jgi:REP element-mobilizing transposase RayT
MSDTQIIARNHAEYTTITCLEWKSVLTEDRFKDIVVESLAFLVAQDRVRVYAFVIMNNHMHMVWQVLGKHRREDVQRDFLKYTGQRIIRILKAEGSLLLDELKVDAKDRKYQVWERNSLNIPLWSAPVLWQKIRYIHENPLRAGLCRDITHYKYSSGSYYISGERTWDFLTHVEG